MKMKTVLVLCVLLLFYLMLNCCASGSAVVIGEQRQPIDQQLVKLYFEEPENYVIIGLVTASSDSGWTDQDSVNYAIAELKKQAAKIGANGILLDKINKSTSGYIFSNGIAIPVTEQNVSGKAILVE